MTAKTIHLGFEVGTGLPVEIPLAHTFVTGQTQLSGKTTTLRAIVERSGSRALAFVTKRGESFEGRRIAPYMPREGEQPIHWRLVETLMASALDQRNMKYERFQIVNAAKGARSLFEVRDNVSRLQAKGGRAAEIYELLGEYLDLVLPEMLALQSSDTLDLHAGLNVMDLGGVSQRLQALVIRAALERINHHEEGVLTVFPEAWEFAPRARSAPAKDEAIAMIRKGAVLRNFLLCDSQDISGVDTVVRQGASVWILGVQRELNELKRSLQTIPAGVARPKPEDIAQLELGQFYACWGRHAIKTYVQPAWMADETARAVATGAITVDQVVRQQASITREAAAVARRVAPERTHFVDDETGRMHRLTDTPPKETTVTKDEAALLTRENEQLKTDNADLRRRLEALEKGSHGTQRNEADRNRRPAARPGDEGDADHDNAHGRPDVRSAADRATPGPARTFTLADTEALYQAIKARLIDEAATNPILLRVLTDRPALDVEVTRKTVTIDGTTSVGRTAQLLAEGFFDKPVTPYAAWNELKRRGFVGAAARIDESVKKLMADGFVTKEADGYQAVVGMKINILEK